MSRYKPIVLAVFFFDWPLLSAAMLHAADHTEIQSLLEEKDILESSIFALQSENDSLRTLAGTLPTFPEPTALEALKQTQNYDIESEIPIIFIEWDRVISGWMKPDKFSRNSSFTAYTFLFEMNVTDAERQNQGVKKVDYKISYRLYSDGASAKVFADAGGNFIPRAASYSCD